MLCLIKLAASTTTQGRNQCSLDLKHAPTCKHSCLRASVLMGEGSHSQTRAHQSGKKTAPDEPHHHRPPWAQQSCPWSQAFHPFFQGLGCLAYPWHTPHSQAASGLHFLLNSARVLWGLPASRFSPLHPSGLSSSNKYITSHKAFPHPVGSGLTSATVGHVSACHLLPRVHPALQSSPTLPKSPVLLWILLLCSCQNSLMQFPTPASLQFHWETVQMSPPLSFFFNLYLL